jgi:microcompartment protein CcmK/EutM
MSSTAAVAAAVLLLSGCDSDPSPPRTNAATTSAPTSASATPTPSNSSPTAATPSETDALAFDAAAATRTVGVLAGDIGPREATSPSYRRAARFVEEQLRSLGYDVARQELRAPAGVSWGVPVKEGRTWNVVARPTGLRPEQPHLVVGAHLDTVPQAPGAEDNASGVAVMLDVARLAAAGGTRLPVVFVAFAAEEPRGTGDDLHHFGSRAMVARLDPAERDSLRGMVALDRVGVGAGGVVPVCTGGTGTTRVRAQLVQAARRVDVTTRTCADNRASDHWSFEKVGLPAARLGSTPYAEYHSAADKPPVVQQAQLRRVGNLLWSWLTG